jgi:hypothetical protein
MKKAEKSGNVLTQTIDEDGNLIGVNNKINFEEREAADPEERDRLSNESIAKEKEIMEEFLKSQNANKEVIRENISL